MAYGTYGTSVAYLLPGMSAKIEISGYFVKHGSHKHEKTNGDYDTYTLQNGFFVENEGVGELEIVEGEPAVIYHHKKYSQNRIMFIARTGEQCMIDIISVPIHDHSSIVTGGPAFGTYFTDDATVDDTE